MAKKSKPVDESFDGIGFPSVPIDETPEDFQALSLIMAGQRGYGDVYAALESSLKSERKFFPGYILAHLDMTDETWHLVKNTPKVTGFLGSGGKPVPITDAEAERVLHQVKEGIERPKPSVTFEVGETVRVCDGPFTSFNGMVEEVDEEKKVRKTDGAIVVKITR